MNAEREDVVAHRLSDDASRWVHQQLGERFYVAYSLEQINRVRRAILTNDESERRRIEEAAAEIAARCFHRLVEDGQVVDVGDMDASIELIAPLIKNLKKLRKWVTPKVGSEFQVLPLWMYLSLANTKASSSSEFTYAEQAALTYAPILQFLAAIKRFERRCLRAEKMMAAARERLKQRQIASGQEGGMDGAKPGPVPQVAVEEAIRELYSLWRRDGKLLGPLDAFQEFVEAVLQPWPNAGKKTKSYKREVTTVTARFSAP
jgi:hypothetical protein